MCSSRGALLIVFLRGRITLLESTENTFPLLKNIKVPLLHRSASQLAPETLPLLVWGQTGSHVLGSFRGKGRERTLSLLFYFFNQENKSGFQPVHSEDQPWDFFGRNDAKAETPALVVKNPPANAGSIRDAGLIFGSGRSPGGVYV